MVQSFKNKALKALWESGEQRKLPPESIKKLNKILHYIEGISHPNELPDAILKQYRVHQLKKPPYIDFWSMDVTGNYRVIFRLENGNAYDIDFLDTH